jgi:hypothetical protein
MVDIRTVNHFVRTPPEYIAYQRQVLILPDQFEAHRELVEALKAFVLGKTGGEPDERLDRIVINLDYGVVIPQKAA